MCPHNVAMHTMALAVPVQKGLCERFVTRTVGTQWRSEGGKSVQRLLQRREWSLLP